ncbi:hypothetical protein [Streptomyces sp. NPDC045714]|uniref:hypothetical protein n=1 Tax=Streptomyces sp. NPDC045714 TaxID=3154913 RepID=UPI0033F49C90
MTAQVRFQFRLSGLRRSRDAMDDRHDARTGGTGDDIAYVCSRLDRIREDLQTYGPHGDEPLERVVTSVRAGQDPTAPLDALHEALLSAGDATGVRSQGRGLFPIGVDSQRPDEWLLLCPTGQCSRHAWPDAQEPSGCRITGQPLRRERL